MLNAIVNEFKKIFKVLATHPTARRLHRAAIYGNAEAMYELGNVYEVGHIVERDCVQAYAMYTFASMKKYKPAQSALKRLKTLLSSAQLDSANKIIQAKITSGFYRGIG